MDFKKTFSDLAQKAKKAGEKGVKMAVAQKDIMVLKGQIKSVIWHKKQRKQEKRALKWQ